MATNIRTGTVTQAATAIALEIECGFSPDYFKIWNQTDGIYEEWFKGMTDAHGLIVDLANTATAGAAYPAQVTVATSLGITPSGDSSTDTFKGVTFGLHTTINIASKVYYWIATTQQ